MISQLSLRAPGAALLALLVAGSALPGPARAGGQVSWTFAPSNREAAGLLDAGLRIYALSNDLRDGSIRQRGRGNSAGLSQRGRGNLGLVEQRGDGHAATLDQRGDRNAYGLFQFGRGAEDHVVQTGGESGATVSYGW
ncbi:curlin [Aureimonas sp. AU4]|uniref:curlin n=1 Tax=Aureimonas sp. AU4 TaxID=1638163 RepID=UPI00078076A6|nr:curlin [Aureimonas sp. AU4]